MDSVNSTSATKFPAVTPDTADAVCVLDVCHWTDRLFSFSVERLPVSASGPVSL